MLGGLQHRIQVEPDLGQESATVDLDATYYDTDDAILRRLGVTLRRRSGGTDAGWHLKVPGRVGRTEFQSEARGGTVPQALSRVVAGVTAGRRLQPVARLQTVRTSHRLLDRARDLLVEVADDLVTGADLTDDTVHQQSHEVEAELGPAGDDELLARLAAVLE